MQKNELKGLSAYAEFSVIQTKQLIRERGDVS